jgi:hypothetical protein
MQRASRALSKRRTDRLDCDDRLEQRRSDIGGQPAGRTAGRVSEQDRWTDRIEQGRGCGLSISMCLNNICLRRAYTGEKVVKVLITELPRSWPLIVQVCLRIAIWEFLRAAEPLFEKRGWEEWVHRTQHIRMEWRAAVARSVDDVDSISSTHEPMGPTFTTIGRSKKIQPLPAAAVDQDERSPVAQGLRNPVLDIHLATQR